MLWRPLLLLLVAACGSPGRMSPASEPGSVQPPPPPEPKRDAAIDGTVTDAQTGRGVVGVTIIASHGESAEPAISDETGHFHIALASGRYRVTTYYAASTVDRGDVDAAANTTVPLALTLPHAVVAAPGSASPEGCPAVADAPATTQDDVDALVAAALARYVADPASIADGELAMHDGMAFVASDAGDVRVTSRGMPAGRTLVLRSKKELDADADRRRPEITYLAIDHVDIVGDCAMIEIGIAIASSEHPPPYRLCCCSTADLYEKQATGWVFKTRLHAHCA